MLLSSYFTGINSIFILLKCKKEKKDSVLFYGTLAADSCVALDLS